jgi:hypothetical protein
VYDWESNVMLRQSEDLWGEAGKQGNIPNINNKGCGAVVARVMRNVNKRKRNAEFSRPKRKAVDDSPTPA